MKCFPFWHGLQDIPHHTYIIIALVYCYRLIPRGNYINIRLIYNERIQWPKVLLLQHDYRLERFVGWKIVYRLKD